MKLIVGAENISGEEALDNRVHLTSWLNDRNCLSDGGSTGKLL
jgi:hypothetical protein